MMSLDEFPLFVSQKNSPNDGIFGNFNNEKLMKMRFFTMKIYRGYYMVAR